jgi:hypothetical protein
VEEQVAEGVVAAGTQDQGAEVGASPGLYKREQLQGGWTGQHEVRLTVTMQVQLCRHGPTHTVLHLSPLMVCVLL